MKNVESYLKEVYEVDSLPIVTFAQSITQLYPLIEKIEGNILLAGHGGYSPERSLFCTPASRYRKPYPEISSITACDAGMFTSPEIFFNLDTQHLIPGEVPLLDMSRINSYAFSLQEVLETLPSEIFDVILFFRVPRLFDQLKEGLLPLIEKSLKPDGFFIGSGSFYSKSTTFPPQFNLGRLIELPNPDYTGFPFHRYHLGFVAKKRNK